MIFLLRELPPLLLLGGAGLLLGRVDLPRLAALGPVAGPWPPPSPSALLLGGGLCLALAAVRLAVQRAARREGHGAGAPGLRLSLGVLLGAEWVLALTFAALALLPLLPDRRLPAALALAGTALLALRVAAEGVRRRRPPPRGEERHWLLGVLYANPRDRSPLVPARLGLGYTPNLGRPAGWLLLLLALGLPAWAALLLATRG